MKTRSTRPIASLLFLLWTLSASAMGTCPLARLDSSTLRVGLVQYEIGRPRDLAAWEAKLSAYVAEAAGAGAQLVVFPELIALDGLALLDPEGEDQSAAIRKVADRYTPYFRKRFSEWSRRFGVTIVAGSWPKRWQDGSVRNVSFVFDPRGKLEHEQAKNHLTSGEISDYELEAAGGNARPFKIGDIDATIAICFDCEFPNYLPADRGVIPELVIVPSMTGDAFGRNRVRRAASARAVEYHSFVLATGTVGGNARDPVLGAHTGQGLVFSPSAHGFPADGILAEGPLDASHVVIADLDFARLRSSRRSSTTFPARSLHETENRVSR